MIGKYALLGRASALALILMLGCGSGQQQQTDASKTEGTEEASTPADQSSTDQQPSSNTPSGQTEAKPSAQKPSPSGTTVKTEPAKPATKKPEPPKMVTVPSGTTLMIALETHLRTDSNKTGDGFRARTTEPVRVGDVTVIPAGSEVRGHLTHVEEPHRTQGKAQMTLAFDEYIDPSGKTYSISVDPIALEGEGDKVSDEEKVAAGAVIGGVIGALTSKKKTKGAVTGAVAGAAAGGAIALATKSKQLDLPPGQQFSIELTAPVEVPVTRLTAGK